MPVPDHDPISLVAASFRDRYVVGELLGKGSYGHVYAAKDKTSGANIALKVILRSRLGAKGEVSVKGEIEVMTVLQHPKILKLHTAATDNKTITLVLDHVQGGEVLRRLVKLKHYSERIACLIMKNLMLGIKYMHDEGFVHRDLKPDNMLLVEKPQDANEAANIRIADFGFATKYRGVPLTQPCGTPYYIAPEILDVGLHKTRPHYTETCDMWSAGVICYLLVSGFTPFDGADKSRLFKAISRGSVSFAHGVWRNVSYECKDFILRLLQTNPAKRMTASMALDHRWLRTVDASPDYHMSETQDNLSHFAAKTKLKGAVFGVEAAFRLRYLTHCKDFSIKPNSAVLELLTAATEVIKRVDLSNNYLGPRGTDALVQVLLQHSEAEVLVLRNCIIDDELAGRILNAVTTPKSRLRRIAFDNNPMTHGTGRRILAVLQAHRYLDVITVTGTRISTPIQRKIEQQNERNIARALQEAKKERVVPTVAAADAGRAETAPAAPGGGGVAVRTGLGGQAAASASPARPSSGSPRRKYDQISLPPLVRKVARAAPVRPKFDPAYR